jgi:hypothetical protein
MKDELAHWSLSITFQHLLPLSSRYQPPPAGLDLQPFGVFFSLV